MLNTVTIKEIRSVTRLWMAINVT